VKVWGVLLPHIVSALIEVVLLLRVALGWQGLHYTEEQARHIGDITRDDARKSREAVASYTRHVALPEFIVQYGQTSLVLVLLNISNIVGVYMEEAEGKDGAGATPLWPLVRIVVAVLTGFLALYIWKRVNKTMKHDMQVRVALVIAHVAALAVVLLAGSGSFSIWQSYN
jgi:hypothetical protein